MRPAVSVVIPTRDTLALTLRCLESVVTEPRPEVLLVDDASEDGTGEAARRLFPDVRILRHDSARGFTASANEGLGAARGSFLFLLNSDTEVAPGALRRMLDAFETHPRLGAAGAELRFPDGAPQWSGGRLPTLPWLFTLASGAMTLLERLPGYRRLRPVAGPARSRIEWVSAAAMLIRREAWLATGPFDARFRFYCQDVDFCDRLRQRGWDVTIVPEALVMHHGGATIARHGNALRRGYDPEFLWTDLLCWYELRHGPTGAARAARAIRLGAGLRIAARTVASPIADSRRPGWNEETRTFRRALARLR
jgi:hypothetical protein